MVEGHMTREQRNQIYIRICRDSGYTLSPVAAAQIVANVTGCHPIEIMGNLGWDNMQRIANGSHPACED